MNPKINGLSHLTFICQDLEKSADMFKSIFGSEEVYCNGDKTFSIAKEKFLQVAGIWIALMEGESIEKIYNHVAFRVSDEDLDEFERRVRSLN